MKLLPLFILGCAFVLPLSASAQWQWIDKDGRKVFSDQPPPADLPEKNILKRAGPPPRVAVAPATATPAADAAAPSAATRATAPVPVKPAGVDKELEEKARKAEEAEKAKRAAEEQKMAQAKAENCQR